MLNVVLVEPEIPQNCGNIARTCAATGSVLHLIEPLGFDISEKAVKRAGLDYWHLVDVRVYPSLEEFFRQNRVTEMWCLSTKAPRTYSEAAFTLFPYTMAATCSSARRPRACRRISWRPIGSPACGCPCGRRRGA